MKELTTDFGEKINREHPLPEHPNPLFSRDSFVSLNGPWKFALTKTSEKPEEFPETILVPFAPETRLSGLGITIHKNDFLHYEKSFDVPDDYVGHDAMLHLDAVDQICDVYFNGGLLAHHESGYFPCDVHVTSLAKNNTIDVVVKDDTESEIFPRGKQSNTPEGVWYTPTSGIWQSVWLEPVPDDGYIVKVKITPMFDEKKLHLHAQFVGNHAYASAEARFHGQLIAKGSFDETGDLDLDFSYNFYPWTPETPDLYELTLFAGYDTVHSYFAMRKFSSIAIGNRHFIGLNNKPIFLSGVLDQGYWPESGLTAPSDEAIVNDLQFLKKAGFNCVRKHIKIEPLRWYYHCDRLGLVVSQDFVNGGSRYSGFLIHTRPFLNFDISDNDNKMLGRLLEQSRQQFMADFKATIDRLYNVPSIGLWTIFNEGWGQFDTKMVTEEVRAADPTRLLDATSGWYDKHTGDFNSQHIYFWVFLRLHNDKKRILALTECGGYSLTVEHHVYSDKSFGYRYYKSFAAYNAAVKRLYIRRLSEAIKKQGLSESIFTQLTDVEEEQNGLMTYDRKISKINQQDMRSLNSLLAVIFSKQIQKLSSR